MVFTNCASDGSYAHGRFRQIEIDESHNRKVITVDYDNHSAYVGACKTNIMAP